MRTLVFCIISCFLLFGCKKKEEIKPIAPPIAQGTCSVYTYLDDGSIFDQGCSFGGYHWYCKEGVCWRKDPLPAEVR